jgi:hypothetical protein
MCVYVLLHVTLLLLPPGVQDAVDKEGGGGGGGVDPSAAIAGLPGVDPEDPAVKAALEAAKKGDKEGDKK